MFGMGGSELIIILVVALLFLGPDKLPEATRKISQGIRELKRQSRALQQHIENDEHIGGAVRDIKSALRGDELPPVRPRVKKPRPMLGDIRPDDEVVRVIDKAVPAAPAAVAPLIRAVNTPDENAEEAEPSEPDDAKPAIRLPPSAGEADPDVRDETSAEDLAQLIRPAPGTVAKGSSEPDDPATSEAVKRHG